MPLFGIVKGNWLNKRENEAGKKTSEQGNRAGTERGPHWLEASALTAGWFLFPNVYEASSKKGFILLL